MLVCMLVISFAVPTFAAKDEVNTYQRSVVMIGATVRYTSSNTSLNFSVSSTGTGFALGKPGEPVQFLGTCAHVVQENAGIYALYVDVATSTITALVPQDEGTKVPQKGVTTYNGRQTVVLIDYFTTKTEDLRAIFSEASNDYTTLTTVRIDTERDLAICKLASDPTTKISALPIQLKEEMKVSDEVIAVGFPGHSRDFNTEARYDRTDSTLEDGIISKIQRTSGNTNADITFDVYDVTADLSKGMSGGPVISKKSGAVIGVTSFGRVEVEQATGDRFAVCVDYLVEMMDAEKIPYKLYQDNFLLIIIIIVAAVILVAGLVVLIVLLARRGKSSSYPEEEPVAPANPVVVAPAAPAPKKYYLIGISGAMAGKKFGVVDRAIIGRDSVKCNVVYDVNQPGVSGLHCEIKISGEVMTLKDCGSSYGTYLVNGKKLEPGNAVVLQNGDRFWIGTKENMFEVKY